MNKKRQRGASLIEVIIILFIVLVLFDLCIMEAQTLINSRKQRYENIAYHIANTQMETLRGTSLASLPPSGNISDQELNLIPSSSGTFTVADYSGYSGLKQLTVTVNWNDGSNKSVTLTTLAGSGGINP